MADADGFGYKSFSGGIGALLMLATKERVLVDAAAASDVKHRSNKRTLPTGVLGT